MKYIDTRDIDERFEEFKQRSDIVQFKAIINRRKMTKKISEIVDEYILTNPQIRTAAYLLGFDDIRYCSSCNGPSGVSSETYNAYIKKIIPQESEIDLSEYDVHVKGKDNIAFRISGIRTAFRELDRKGKLDYTKDRFDYILKRI